MISSGNFIDGLGFFPNDWSVKSADEISLKITKGTTPPKNEIVDSKEIPFLRVNNLSFNGELEKKSDFIFVSRKAHEGFLARSKAYAGDILMNIVGPPLGKVSILGSDFKEYNMNQAIVIYRLIDNVVCRDYFLSYLLSDIAQQWLQSRSKKTSGQQNLTIELCKSLPVPLPPLPEQQKIAQILSTWDKAIRTTEQLLANSQQQKKALMQQLLTGQRRLLDADGVRFSGEWSFVEIRELLAESRIPSKDNDPTKRLTVRLNLNGVEAREFRGTEATESTAHFVRKAGQFIYGKQNIHKGAFGIIPNNLDGYESSQDLPAFDFKGNCNEIWFFHYVSHEIFHHSLEDKMSGTGSKRLSPSSFFNVKILKPTLKEQQKIAAVLSAADQEISTLQQQLTTLKQEKKALMQQLLTGKVRVKLTAPVGAN